MRNVWVRAVGIVLLVAFVVSWFVWGPLGLIFYVGGLFNMMCVYMLIPLLFPLIPAAAIFLPVWAVCTAVRWRRLSRRSRISSSLMVVVLAAFVASFGIEFAGLTPTPFDMFFRGFTRYVESRLDIAAVQDWLGTLDPNEYSSERGYETEKRLAPSELPQCLARVRGGARVRADDQGRLTLHLLCGGGGLIGPWGVVVGDRSMKPPDSDSVEYELLAPGAWIWH